MRVRLERAAREFYNQKIGDALKPTNLHPGDEDEYVVKSPQVALTTL